MAFTYNKKSLKKSYQFLKYTRAYLRKGRNAPELQTTRDKHKPIAVALMRHRLCSELCVIG